MAELNFTIEFHGEGIGEQIEAYMFSLADARLQKLAAGYNALRGAAVNVRLRAKAESRFIYEVTIVVCARPTDIAASQKDGNPLTALNNPLSAVERQVRKKRGKLR